MSTTVIATIFVFGLLVLVHELGHFLTAKAVGMRVDEFAIGFGPKIFSRKHGDTIYSLRVVPLGGFNKIAGMDPDEEQDEQSFNAKPILSRMLVIIAGSAMNLILPVLLFVIVFLSVGIDSPSDQPVIGSLLPNKPAAQAGLQPGDRVLEVNDVPVKSWQQFVSLVQQNTEPQLKVEYLRGTEERATFMTPEYDPRANRGVIGVMPQITTLTPGFFESVKLAVQQTFYIAASMLVGIVQMVTGQIEPDVAGPIGVAQMAGQVAQLGFAPLLQFAAFLSINLGLINLLPVPVLDGGHVVTLAVEGVRGKPLSRDSIQFIQMVGFALLMMLFLLATFKDVARLQLF